MSDEDECSNDLDRVDDEDNDGDVDEDDEANENDDDDNDNNEANVVIGGPEEDVGVCVMCGFEVSDSVEGTDGGVPADVCVEAVCTAAFPLSCL